MKFLVCYVLILIIVPSSAVVCRVSVCLFLAKVRCPWRTCMYVCNVCMYVLSNMWLLYFSSEQSAWVGAHDDPRPQPRPEFQPLPSTGGGLPALGRPGQRGHQEGERIHGKNSPELWTLYFIFCLLIFKLFVLVCWCAAWIGWSGIHGQKFQKQAKRYEGLSVFDSYSPGGSGNCDW